jgi:hypothetical protein
VVIRPSGRISSPALTLLNSDHVDRREASAVSIIMARPWVDTQQFSGTRQPHFDVGIPVRVAQFRGVVGMDDAADPDRFT